MNFHREAIISSFPQPQVNAAMVDLQTMGIDTSAILPTTTIGEAFELCIDQMPSTVLPMQLYDWDSNELKTFFLNS